MLGEHGFRRTITGFMAVALAAVGSAAQAVSVEDLYEVTLPVERNADAAFEAALKAVAVRVSGQRDAPSRLTASAGNPRHYVQRFSFTADEQLQVVFDSVSIDRLLGQSGLPVWGRERPLTLVLLNVAGGGGSLWVDAHSPALEREALNRIARERGVPLAWPTLDGVDRSMLETAEPAQLLALAARHQANAVLLGEMRRDASGASMFHWRLIADESAAETLGGIGEGVHLAADTFARLFGTVAGQLDTVSVEVSGIEDLNDYASTLSYLSGMTLVRQVSIEQVSGDTMRFQLAVRGDAATLRRALALDDKLVPVQDAGVESTDRLQLRLQR